MNRNNDKNYWKQQVEGFDNSIANYLALLYVGMHGGIQSGFVVGYECAPNDGRAVEDVLNAAYGRQELDPQRLVGIQRSRNAVLAIHDDYLCFYVYSKLAVLGIESKAILPYTLITNVSVKKSLFGVNRLKITFTSWHKSTFILYIAAQEDAMKVFVDHLRIKGCFVI